MIGDRIAELRQHQGLSQTALAMKLGLSTKSIKNWENGISSPSAENIALLAKCFGVSCDHLLDIDDKRAIYIDSLSPSDQSKVLAILQIFINQSSIEHN